MISETKILTATVMCGNASCILYFKQIINTHVKNFLADAQPSTASPQASTISTADTTTSTTLLNQQPHLGKS